MNNDTQAESLAQSDTPLNNTLLGIKEYPERFRLHSEMHARTEEYLDSPSQVSHLVLLSDDEDTQQERKLLAQLCERYAVMPPTVNANQFSAELGVVSLRWERHTIYSTYTFFHSAPFDTPFADPAINHISSEWLASLPGQVVSATHIALEEKGREQRSLSDLAKLFSSNTVIGSEVAAGHAIVWTDQKIHADGFGRILIRDVELSRRQAARLVQRLKEIETYRMLAMLPVPMMRSTIPQLNEFDERLAALAENNMNISCLEDEQKLLDELTQLAAEIERISAKTSQSYNSSVMFYEIVKLRVSELREQRIQGLQMFEEFIEQRLAPAMNSCTMVHLKLESLSTRVARTLSLLRTRIEITMEQQNRDLLRSMDKRAHLQLRLQETVEGLSIVVLSYYLLGLASYGFKALKAAGVGVNVELATGLAIPVVVGTVFLLVRRMKKMVHKDSK